MERRRRSFRKEIYKIGANGLIYDIVSRAEYKDALDKCLKNVEDTNTIDLINTDGIVTANLKVAETQGTAVTIDTTSGLKVTVAEVSDTTSGLMTAAQKKALEGKIDAVMGQAGKNNPTFAAVSATEDPTGKVKLAASVQAVDASKEGHAAATGLATDAYVNEQIAGAIDALDMDEVTVGASKTLSSIKEENGVVTATAVDIQIAESQVTGLVDDLAKKLEKSNIKEGNAYVDVLTGDGNDVSVSVNVTSNFDATVSENTVADASAIKAYVDAKTAATYKEGNGIDFTTSGNETTISAQGNAAKAIVVEESGIGVNVKSNDKYIQIANNAIETKGIDDAITAAIAELDKTDTAVNGQVVRSVSETDGVITVTRSALADTDIKLEAIAQEEGSVYASQYKLVNGEGTQLGATINIAKDQFLKEVHFYKAQSDVPSGVTVPTGTEFPVIRFIFTTAAGDTESWVSVKDLVDVYTAGDGIAIDNNVVSADIASANAVQMVGESEHKQIGLVIDSATPGNVVLSQSANGLSANLNMDAYKVKDVDTTADAGVSLTLDANGKVGVNVAEGAVAENNSSVVLGGAVYTAIKAEETRAKAAEQANADDIDALEDRMTAAETNITNNTNAIAAIKDGTTIDSFADVETALADKVDKTATIAGVDLQDNITKDELLTALNVEDGAQVNKLEGVQVNGADLTIDNNKKVNVTVATGKDNGTIAVNGSDVAVKGLGSAAYTESSAYATAVQGALADTALQSISKGTDGDYVTTTIRAKTDNNDQSVSVALTLQNVSAASETDKGLAEASDVKAYVDEQVAAVTHKATLVNSAEITDTTAANSNFIKVKDNYNETDKQHTYNVDAVTVKSTDTTTFANNGLATDGYVQEVLAWEVID